MTKPNNEEVDFLLTHRRGYLERLLADIEAGRVQMTSMEDLNSERRLEFSPRGHVWIPAKVWDGLEQIRQSGVCNMADMSCTVAEARRLEMPHVVNWVIANPVAMMTAIIQGAESKPEGIE